MTLRSQDMEADEDAWMRWKLVRTVKPALLDQAEPDRIFVNPTHCAPLLEGFPLLLDDESGEISEPVLYFLRSQYVDAHGNFCKNTVWSYAEDLKDWFRFLDTINVRWTNSRLAHLNSYCTVMERTESPLTGKVYSSQTINRRLAAINSFYAWARIDGFAPEPGDMQRSSPANDASGNALPAPKKTVNDFVLGPAFSALEDKGFSRRALKRPAANTKESDEDDDSGVVKVLLPNQSAALFAALGPKPSQITASLKTQSDEELHEAIQKVSARDRLAAEIPINTGLRIEEVTRLKVGRFTNLDIDGLDPGVDLQVSIVGKGGKRRVVDFPVFLITEIQLYIKSERRLAIAQLARSSSTQRLLVNGFPSGGRNVGRPTSIRTIQRCFSKACIRAGLTMSKVAKPEKLIPAFWFHTLRHTYAVMTYYARKRAGDTEPWKYIQQRLGHKFLSTTTDTYLAVTATFEAAVSDRYMSRTNG